VSIEWDWGPEPATWSDLFDMNALVSKVEALEARIIKLEEDRDHLLDYINQQNYIQPAPLGGWLPRNRGGKIG